MIQEFILNHMFMSGIAMIGILSLFMQTAMALSLKGYVKSSANMKTTRKKLMINLKNQFETIYGMDYQIHNTAAYVDKYLLKMRVMGLPYQFFEKLPYLTAGLVALLTVIGEFYGYTMGVKNQAQVEILFTSGLVLVCLYVFFHIFGIKSKKEQIQIQLVDYLENYLANRLTKTKEGGRESNQLEEIEQNESVEELADVASETAKGDDEDVKMLRKLLHEMEYGKQEEKERYERDSEELIAASKEGSELELLEEFVQSFLA